MNLRKHIELLLVTGASLLLLASCNNPRFFEENIKIPGGEWHSDNILTFSPVISDTLARYNIYLDVRNDIGYSYSNLYLFMRTVFPNGLVTHDTIECTLAAYDGKWLGSGTGNLRFNRFLFQQGVKFRIPGTYRIELEQAMRAEVLKGIRDIGLRIDKSN